MKKEDRRKMRELRELENKETPDEEGSGEQITMGRTHTENELREIDKESKENRSGW